LFSFRKGKIGNEQHKMSRHIINILFAVQYMYI
jgi:hypothetical protein